MQGTMRQIQFVISGLVSLALVACGGGSGGAQPVAPVSPSTTIAIAIAAASGYPGEPSSCTLAGQKLWLDDYMADQYFWAANRAVPNSAADTPGAYFQSQLFTPTDRYSYSQSAAQFNQFFVEGTRTGYGYSLAYSDSTQTKLQLRLVEPLSPAAAAGLKRGDTVLAIDGFSPTNIVSGSLTTVSTSGVPRTFTVDNLAGGTRLVTVVSRTFLLSPVLADGVLTSASGAKVGYLAYQEFTTNSLAAVGAAFDRFRAAGVTELIVDLRYNGGGSVTAARALASLIGGTPLSGRVFAALRYNAKNAASDFDYPFVGSAASLPTLPLEGLARVMFITSANTASASELVVNSLLPFKQVVTVGAATFGKPYGFLPRSACDVVYNAVNFETFNAAGAGRYNSGLPATCSVPDDLSKALGDPAEGRTAAALGYIQSNACPAVASTVAQALAIAKNTVVTQPVHVISAIKTGAGTVYKEPAFGEINPPRMIVD